eukprot:3987259-Pyramimonas_sp.AAC.1
MVRAVDVSRRPAVYELMDDRTSLPRYVCQYYSSMARGAVDSLHLVWGLSSHESLEGWMADRPALARAVRRVVLRAAAWVAR